MSSLLHMFKVTAVYLQCSPHPCTTLKSFKDSHSHQPRPGPSTVISQPRLLRHLLQPEQLAVPRTCQIVFYFCVPLTGTPFPFSCLVPGQLPESVRGDIFGEASPDILYHHHQGGLV